MHALAEPTDPIQPKPDDRQHAPTACAPKPESASRTFISEWRKILGGLVG